MSTNLEEGEGEWEPGAEVGPSDHGQLDATCSVNFLLCDICHM